MLIRVTMKTPDAFCDAAEDAARREAEDKGWPADSEEFALAYEQALEQARKVAEKFLAYGECVTVEFNTAEGTARVIPRGG